jgi:hypothetical protein
MISLRGSRNKQNISPFESLDLKLTNDTKQFEKYQYISIIITISFYLTNKLLNRIHTMQLTHKTVVETEDTLFLNS